MNDYFAGYFDGYFGANPGDYWPMGGVVPLAEYANWTIAAAQPSLTVTAAQPSLTVTAEG